MKVGKRGAVLLLLIAAGATAFVAWRNRPAEIVNANPSGSNIIALGDSLTVGYGGTSGKDYVTLLSQKIGRPVLNRGVLGDTTADGLRRLDADVLAHDPQIVIIFLGGNDVLGRASIDQTFANLDAIVRRIQARGAMVVLVEFRPPTMGLEFGRRFKQLARERGCVRVPNVFHGIFTDPRMKSDQIHFNDRGYAVLADRIYEAMKPHLTK